VTLLTTLPSSQSFTTSMILQTLPDETTASGVTSFGVTTVTQKVTLVTSSNAPEPTAIGLITEDGSRWSLPSVDALECKNKYRVDAGISWDYDDLNQALRAVCGTFDSTSARVDATRPWHRALSEGNVPGSSCGYTLVVEARSLGPREGTHLDHRTFWGRVSSTYCHEAFGLLLQQTRSGCERRAPKSSRHFFGPSTVAGPLGVVHRSRTETYVSG
jgi:hypothetical protein